MKYYITKADEMVGPLGMEKPKCWGHPINAFSLCPDCERFKPHLASLARSNGFEPDNTILLNKKV